MAKEQFLDRAMEIIGSTLNRDPSDEEMLSKMQIILMQADSVISQMHSLLIEHTSCIPKIQCVGIEPIVYLRKGKIKEDRER
jgi:hypothetical protein